jgi:hypothetical protein
MTHGAQRGALVLIHASFVAAFNACMEAEPDERKAYALLKETVLKSTSRLSLHGYPVAI